MHNVIESTKDAYKDEDCITDPMPMRITLCGQCDLQTVLAVLDVVAKMAMECL